MLHRGLASFDKLRMRFFLYGMAKMPFSIFLILSLSKEAQAALQQTRVRARESEGPRRTINEARTA